MSVRGLFAGAGSQPTGAASYRYWRIYVQTNNGGSVISFAEIELRGTTGGADLTSSSTPATHSSATSGTSATNTVDNDTAATIWMSASGQATNQWCRYDLSTAKVVAQAAIYPTDGLLTSTPKDFIIQGSNDGTNFTDVKSFTNVTGWTAAWRTFDL